MTHVVGSAASTLHESMLQTAAGALGLELPAEQVERLLRFNRLLQRWNAVYNLTSVRDLEAALTLHVIDCLAAVLPLRRQLASSDQRLLDVGSGGGLPGVIFAITNPSLDVICIDAVGKKAAFVTQVAGELGQRNLSSVHRRAEEFAGSFAVIASRAFSSLNDFARITGHVRASSGVWMAMKGKAPTEEIAELPSEVSVFHVEHLNVPGLAAERCIVWMRPSAPMQLD